MEIGAMGKGGGGSGDGEKFALEDGKDNRRECHL